MSLYLIKKENRQRDKTLDHLQTNICYMYMKRFLYKMLTIYILNISNKSIA